MKKFKHKTKDITLTKCKNGNSYYSENFEGYYIPSDFIEDSCDWEEIKEDSFITEDGVELFGGETVISVHTGCSIMAVCYGFSVKNFKESTCLFFAKKENAEKYIELNAKKYSIKDIVLAVNNWAMSPCIDENDILSFLAKNK